LTKIHRVLMLLDGVMTPPLQLGGK
jgi:hypothetical protein